MDHRSGLRRGMGHFIKPQQGPRHQPRPWPRSVRQPGRYAARDARTQMLAAVDARDARRGWLPRLETAPVPTWAVVLPGPGRVRKCRDRAYWDKQARRGTGAPGHEPNSAQPPRASQHTWARPRRTRRQPPIPLTTCASSPPLGSPLWPLTRTATHLRHAPRLTSATHCDSPPARTPTPLRTTGTCLPARTAPHPRKASPDPPPHDGHPSPRSNRASPPAHTPAPSAGRAPLSPDEPRFPSPMKCPPAHGIVLPRNTARNGHERTINEPASVQLGMHRKHRHPPGFPCWSRVWLGLLVPTTGWASPTTA